MKFIEIIAIATMATATPASMSTKDFEAKFGKRAIDRVDCELDWLPAYAADAANAINKLEDMIQLCEAPAGECKRMTCGTACASTWICGGAQAVSVVCNTLPDYGWVTVNECGDGTLESTVVGEAFDTAGWSVRISNDQGCC